MALFPKIKGACPYLDRLDDLITDGHCSMCNREVADITMMTDDQRMKLVCDRKGDVCVRYMVMVPVMAVAALSMTPELAAAKEKAPAHHQHATGVKRARVKPPAPPLMVPMPTAGIVMPPRLSHPVAGSSNGAPPPSPSTGLAEDHTAQVEWVEFTPVSASSS